MTPVLEIPSVANRGARRCRCHRADAFDLAETLADLAVARELSGDPCIHLGQFFPQLRNQFADKGMQSAVLTVAADPRQTPPQIADILCDDNALLRLQRPRQGELSMNPWL